VRITEISATIRFSAEAKGAWWSIELGATATLTASDETLETAQQELYKRLSSQLKALWANGNGKAETQEQPKTETCAPPKEHWCSEHNQAWAPKKGKYGVFYSHKAPDGSWCNETK
jgi:hypothetical protein